MTERKRDFHPKITQKETDNFKRHNEPVRTGAMSYDSVTHLVSKGNAFTIHNMTSKSFTGTK